MSKMVTRAFLMALCGVVFLADSMAWADAFSYSLGRQLGEQTTRSAWLSVSRGRGCDAADDLVAVITRSARRIGRTARRYQKRDMVDYAEGYIHGLRATLRDVAIQCTDKCGSIGEAAGSATAIVYCELSDLLGEIPVFIRMQDMPNITCGEPYRIQCEISFENITMSDCPDYTGKNPVDIERYNSYYLADRGGACSYNPPRP